MSVRNNNQTKPKKRKELTMQDESRTLFPLCAGRIRSDTNNTQKLESERIGIRHSADKAKKHGRDRKQGGELESIGGGELC